MAAIFATRIKPGLTVHAVTSEDTDSVPPGPATNVLDPTHPWRPWRTRTATGERIILRATSTFGNGALVISAANHINFDLETSNDAVSWTTNISNGIIGARTDRVFCAYVPVTTAARTYIAYTPKTLASGATFLTGALVYYDAADLVTFLGDIPAWPTVNRRARGRVEIAGGGAPSRDIGNPYREFTIAGELWRSRAVMPQLRQLRSVPPGSPILWYPNRGVTSEVLFASLAPGWRRRERVHVMQTDLVFSEFV